MKDDGMVTLEDEKECTQSASLMLGMIERIEKIAWVGSTVGGSVWKDIYPSKGTLYWSSLARKRAWLTGGDNALQPVTVCSYSRGGRWILQTQEDMSVRYGTDVGAASG